jgi:hypothetical protein
MNTWADNFRSHTFDTDDDDTIRCIYCEIGAWNGHKTPCTSSENNND